MDNSCFYFGVQTAYGVHSGFFNSEKIKIIYALSGGSPEFKTKIFHAFSKELETMKIENEILSSWNGCFGVYCSNLKLLVADALLLSDEQLKKVDLIFDLNRIYDGDYSQKLYYTYEKERFAKIERCRRFLTAAEGIKTDAVRLDSKSLDAAKIFAYSARLWKRSGGKMQGRVGTEEKHFVTCMTPDGTELNMKFFDDCEQLAVIADKTGAAANVIVERVRRYALSSGYDVVSCVCSLDRRTTEHIIVPELSFGVFSSEYYHRIVPKRARKTYAQRFHTRDAGMVKNRLNFSLKAYRSLMNEAFDSLAEARLREQKLNYVFSEITDIDRTVDMMKAALK